MLGMSQISRELLFGDLAIHRVPTTPPHFYKCNLQQMSLLILLSMLVMVFLFKCNLMVYAKQCRCGPWWSGSATRLLLDKSK